MNRDELIEKCAEASHNAYEDAAQENGWETQERSRVPWADVPEANKETVRASLRAALPLIEADVREQVAAEIVGDGPKHPYNGDETTRINAWCDGLHAAARVARGATQNGDSK